MLTMASIILLKVIAAILMLFHSSIEVSSLMNSNDTYYVMIALRRLHEKVATISFNVFLTGELISLLID